MRTFVVINLSAQSVRFALPFDCTLLAAHFSVQADMLADGSVWLMDAPVAADADGLANGSAIAVLKVKLATIINTSISNLKISLKSGQFLYLQNVDGDHKTYVTLSVDKP